MRFSGGKRTVIDGPFAETKELIAGFWILQGEVAAGSDRLGRSAAPNPFPGRNPRSRSGRSSKPKTSARNSAPELRAQEERRAGGDGQALSDFAGRPIGIGREAKCSCSRSGCRSPGGFAGRRHERCKVNQGDNVDRRRGRSDPAGRRPRMYRSRTAGSRR